MLTLRSLRSGQSRPNPLLPRISSNAALLGVNQLSWPQTNNSNSLPQDRLDESDTRRIYRPAVLVS